MNDIKLVYRKEFDLYDDIFKISYSYSGIPHSDVVPNGLMVKEILKRLEEIWDDIPQYTKLIKEESDNNLSCLILASNSPHVTLPSIGKNALLSEKILIPHPMLYYLNLNGVQGPYYQPEAWAEEFMKSALYICSLRDWISDDIIRLIPTPSQWSKNVENRKDNTLKKEYQEKALKNFKPELYEKDFIIESLTDMDDKMREFILNKMKKENFKNYCEIINRLNEVPSYPEWLNIKTANTKQIFIMGVMLNPVEVKYLINNWNIYVNPLGIIEKNRLINDMKTNYNVVNKYINDVNINFPKNLPLNYIYDCRKSGMLYDFRKYMLEQYEKVRNINTEEDIQNVQKLFSETIDNELQKLDADLKGISKDLGKGIFDTAINNAGPLYELTKGNISISSLFSLVGSAANNIVPKIHKYRKSKKNPLIILYNIKN